MRCLIHAVLALMFVAGLCAGQAEGEVGVQLTVTPAPAALAMNSAPAPVYLKIAARVPARSLDTARLPVNVVLLLDASASMEGEKAVQARMAAAAAIGVLEPGDTVSVVTYSSTVWVLVPASRLTDPASVVGALDGLAPQGDTAIFAGLSKAGGELMKGLEPNGVNRIVLLSDGRANVGPGGTADLVRLARSLYCEGISITTIGLGSDYFEDLMLQLAEVGGGNHYYAAAPGDLTDIFQHEFTESVDAVAKDVSLEVEFGPGVRPVLALGHRPHLETARMSVHLGTLFAGQEKYVIVEAQTTPDALGPQSLGMVRASYIEAGTGEAQSSQAGMEIRVVPAGQAVADVEDRDVLEAFVRQVGAEKNRIGTDLMDAGQAQEAAAWLRQNAEQLEDWAARLDSTVLREDALRNRHDAASIESRDFEARRKSMRFYQNVITNQMPVSPPESIRGRGIESESGKGAP